MIEIKTKKESLEWIKKKNLNYFFETIFETGFSLEDVKNFLDAHNEKFFILRDKSGSGGKAYYKLTKEEVFAHIYEYDSFSLDVASLNYQENILLIGEVLLKKDMMLTYSVSTNKGSNQRVFLEPSFFGEVNLLYEKPTKIPSLDKVVDYLFHHELFDVIVEFCCYDCLVGCKSEDIAIFELRNKY